MRILTLGLFILISCNNLFQTRSITGELGVYSYEKKDSTYKIELKGNNSFELLISIHNLGGAECSGTYQISADTIYFLCQEIEGIEKYTAGSLSGHSFFGLISPKLIRFGNHNLRRND